MNRDEALGILQSAALDYELARKEMEFQRQRMEGLRLMKAGILKLYPDLENVELNAATVTMDVPADRPKGADAVAWILRQTPGKWFSVRMVVHELEVRGWLPEDSVNPMNATRTALERLLGPDSDFQKDLGQKTGRAVYAYKPTGNHPPNEEENSLASAEARLLQAFPGEDAPGQ